MVAEVRDIGVDDRVDGVAQCAQLGVVRDRGQLSIERAQVALCQFRIDLVPVGEIVIQRCSWDASPLTGRFQRGRFVALLA